MPAPWRARFSVLGVDFDVESTDEALLALAAEAFGGLPRQRLGSRRRRVTTRLVLTDHAPAWARDAAPPRPTLNAGGGLLCAAIDAGSFAVMDAAMSRALVCVSRALLGHRYHARYELIELAFLTLASRVQRLVPLHAACVGLNGNGVLLMGPSGAGKSTLGLCALQSGLELLSEDSAFVAAESLRVAGVPNYLHVLPSALGFLHDGPLRESLERSQVIERRSGARKLEVNLRELEPAAPAAPLRLVATVFLSRRPSRAAAALERLPREIGATRLRREQPYAQARSDWAAFERGVLGVPSFELRRTRHPGTAVRLLRRLLEKTPRA